jgi:heat shock protein HtpX
MRKTWILFTLFLLFIVGLGWLFSYALDNYWILVIAAIFSIAQSITTFWFSDKLVTMMTGARPIQKQDNPELYRLVENLSITAGLPVPKIYIIEESQPNAFATGRDANHAVVAVTRGLLNKLERRELEGVLAHEMSHIGNKDMLLSTVVVIMVSLVALLSRLFLRMSFYTGGSRRKRDSSRRAGALIFLMGIIGAILAPIIALLIQLAISRKREFLADATGALITRYPEGLASALEKISSDSVPMNSADNSTAHLFFANPFKDKNLLTSLFSTHPAPQERIKILRGMKT